jgi:hypothetical protein
MHHLCLRTFSERNLGIQLQLLDKFPWCLH